MAKLDDVLNAWAIWVHKGSVIPAGGSMMAQMIENKGVMNFGSSSGRGGASDCIEAQVEHAVMVYQRDHSMAVKILRLEFGASRMRGFDPTRPQRFKAQILGISERTYRRHLNGAKQAVLDHLREWKSHKVKG